MTQSSEASSDQVLVECSSLSPLLRNDLQAFLERQPEVRAVTRKLRVSEAYRILILLRLVAPRFDVLGLALLRQTMGPHRSSRKLLTGPLSIGLANADE